MLRLKLFSRLIVVGLVFFLILKRKHWIKDSFYALVGTVVLLKKYLQEALPESKKPVI